MPAGKSLIVILAVLAVAAPAAEASRLLKANRGRDWGDSGDPSGYGVLASARSFDGGRGTPKRAVTPEAAESTANNKFMGFWRREMDAQKNTVAFATAEALPEYNPDRAKQTVQTRARSAIDTPERPVDQISGNAMVPAVAMGTAALAQTFEGALSVAASDSIIGNGRTMINGRPTTHANSMITSYTPEVPRASRAASYGATAQTANSVSLAGPADGKMTVAQAHEVAAVAQASGSNYDQWQSDPRDNVGKKSNT